MGWQLILDKPLLPPNNDNVCNMAIPKLSVTALCHNVLIVIDTSGKLERYANSFIICDMYTISGLNFMTGFHKCHTCTFLEPQWQISHFTVSVYLHPVDKFTCMQKSFVHKAESATNVK